MLAFLQKTNPRAGAALLLALMLTLMVLAGLRKPLSYDEPHNLQYGYQFLTQGPSVEPDGQRMPFLALNAMSCRFYRCDFEILRNSEGARFGVRFPGMIFALLTGLLIFRWASRLFSPGKALFPLALYCLNPNFIAHGKQLTSDAATSFFVLAAVYAFWRLHNDRSAKHLFLCAFLTGLAILAKYSSIILLPVFTLLYFLHFKFLKKDKAFKYASSLFFFGSVVWLTINAGYFFDGTFTRAGDIEWKSQKYQKLADSPLPVPFPKVFTLGLDYTQYLDENPGIGRGNNYIFEKRRRRGRWYAFPSMIGLKTPLAFFALLVLGLLSRNKWKEKSFLLIPFGVWLIVFSLACDAQLGIRYVLPGFVFLFLLAGYCLDGPISALKKKLIAALTAWYALSTLSYHPHYVSYFNELIGPRVNAWKYLADSNLDWEDKTYFLKKFQAEHPELNAEIKPTPQTTGYFILSANDYTGVLDEREYETLRNNYKPLRHVAYSHFLFQVPENAK